MADFRRSPPSRSFRRALSLAVVLVAAEGAAWAQSGGAPVPDPAPSPPASRAQKSDGLSADLMYRLLVGDVALQRGEPAIAARAYYEAARETRDPAFARRATEVAVAARQRSLAIESARLWSELDPAAARPRQVIAAYASGAGATPEASVGSLDLKAHLEKLLAETAATNPSAVGEAFLQLNPLLAQEADKTATYRLVTALAQPYPNVAEAQFAVALAALNTGLAEIATTAAARQAVDRALALRPGWERAVVLKSEILGRQSPADAIAYLTGFLRESPTSRPAAGALAQFYVEQRRYAEARAVFEQIWERDKSSREIEFGIATLSIQMKDWATAEKLLEDLKAAGYGENGVVEFYLAQVADERGQLSLAIERYRAVPEGDRGWLAKLRIAAVMGKQNRVGEARKYLAELPAVTIEERVQVRQAEAQLLRDAGDNAGAYAVLAEALAAQPDQPDLLYDLAMAAEKLGRIDEAEARLKRLLEITPNSAHALNALGYTLVDRTPRTAEGLALIERALKLAPDDPFILDSMGWALFKMGKVDEAESYLRRAFDERADPEIAAHLGEVLWTKGERERARELWDAQLKANPDNAVLRETVRRLAR
jgi:tetratricopeptide (TPR) repeat protein